MVSSLHDLATLYRLMERSIWELELKSRGTRGQCGVFTEKKRGIEDSGRIVQDYHDMQFSSSIVELAP